MKRLGLLPLVLLATLGLFSQLESAHAEIIATGDVMPSLPWDSSTAGSVGGNSLGNLLVNGGSDLCFYCCSIGYHSGTGGVTVSDEFSIVGYLGSGGVTVSGEGSTWTNSDVVHIGDGGSGTLAITDGGTVINLSGLVGYMAGSTGEVTVSGTGSTWNSGLGLSIGEWGDGTPAITDGGTVNSGEGRIGFLWDSTGEVTVSGAGSTWTNNYLDVGHYGNARLTITDGGIVTVAHATRVAYDAASTGTIAFGSGGGTLSTRSLYASPAQLTGTGTVNTRGLVSDTVLIFDQFAGLAQTRRFDDEPDQNIIVNLDMSDPGNVGDLGTGYEGSGSIRIRGGITVRSSDGWIGLKSGSTGTATVRGAGSTWTNSGDLHVGENGSGTLTIIEGGLASAGGVLTIDFDTNGDSFINMSTGGMLALFGDADDSLADFLDLIDGTDAIRYWDDSTADWADITDATPETDYTLAYIDEVGNGWYGYTLLTVETIPEPIPGDADGNNLVNETDAATLAAHWGRTGGWAEGDFDGDGVVGPRDASILAANGGYGSEQGSQSSAVPEPGGVVMLLVGAAMLLAWRSR